MVFPFRRCHSDGRLVSKGLFPYPFHPIAKCVLTALFHGSKDSSIPNITSALMRIENPYLILSSVINHIDEKDWDVQLTEFNMKLKLPVLSL